MSWGDEPDEADDMQYMLDQLRLEDDCCNFACQRCGR